MFTTENPAMEAAMEDMEAAMEAGPMWIARENLWKH